MLRLGSVVLASVLLGVPRALNARAFGVQESVCVEASPLASELREFARELERELARAPIALTARRSEATVVVDVLSVVRSPDGAMRAVGLAVTDGRSGRALVLHYEAGGAAEAARELVRALGPVSRQES
jgi:hypothetical protein